MDQHEGREMLHLMESNLELSREVQELLLPSTPPDIDGYAFFDYFQATTHVGGSYYDYIRLADGRLVVVVADILGHGIAAALTMAKLSGEVRFCLASESDPAIAATQLNNRMCEIVAATDGDPSQIGNSLLTQVLQHLGDQPPDDDMCLISFGRIPNAQLAHMGT